MNRRQAFLFLSRDRIPSVKINELLEQPFLPTQIGQSLLTLGYTQIAPNLELINTFYSHNPLLYANERIISGEWLKVTSIENTSIYLMAFTHSLYIEIRPHLNRISILIKKFSFEFRYNPDPITVGEIIALIQHENTHDTPLFCFYDRLLNFMDTEEERARLQEFKHLLVYTIYGRQYRIILQALVAFINSNEEIRIRPDEIPIIPNDKDLFREMVKIVPIANEPLEVLGTKKRTKKSKNKNRKSKKKYNHI